MQKIAEEIISGGTVNLIRAEDSITMKAERFISDNSRISEKDKSFIV